MQKSKEQKQSALTVSPRSYKTKRRQSNCKECQKEYYKDFGVLCNTTL